MFSFIPTLNETNNGQGHNYYIYIKGYNMNTIYIKLQYIYIRTNVFAFVLILQNLN